MDDDRKGVPLEYEFSEQHNQVVRHLSTSLWVLGIALLAAGGVFVAMGAWSYAADEYMSVGIMACLGLPLLAFGLLALAPAVAFGRIVTSTGGDMGHLVPIRLTQHDTTSCRWSACAAPSDPAATGRPPSAYGAG